MKINWKQFGIRELLSIATIVALGTSLYLAVVDNLEMRERYSNLFSAPHLKVWSPAWMDRMSSGGSIGIDGYLFHNEKHQFTQAPTLSVKLIDPRTQIVIRELTNYELRPSRKGHIFGLTLRHGGVVVKPGTYLVLVEAFDGTTAIDRVCTVVDLIELQK